MRVFPNPSDWRAQLEIKHADVDTRSDAAPYGGPGGHPLSRSGTGKRYPGRPDSADQALAPPPEFVQAAQAFGQCVSTGASALPATVTPEAGAKQTLSGCQAQKTALETRFEAWISGPGFPEAGRATAREQFRIQIAGVEPQLVERIRAARATTPTPPPAANAAPTPSR